MTTWADIDRLKRDHPKPLKATVRLDYPGWRCFADATALRFYAHAHDPRVSIRRPCGFVPGKWRQAGSAQPSERPPATVFHVRAVVACAEREYAPLYCYSPIPWSTWRAVLVALDAWREAGCPVLRPPPRVEWLP